MKELSIEGKAKAYDDIIKKANKMLHENCEACQICIEELIPKLKESENERIRKELIEYIKDQQSSFISAPDCRDKYEEEENNKYNSWIAWLEKQCEKGINGKNREIPFSEKKPAWSEEDENRINRLIAYFEDKESFTAEDDVVYANWLKSLKDRVQPQPKQEWSEEDKDKLNRIYSILGQAADTHAFSTTCSLIGDRECIELQDFLKSIRHQKQWKPSDEQMRELSIVAKGKGWFSKEILSELLEQLKKLKG